MLLLLSFGSALLLPVVYLVSILVVIDKARKLAADSKNK